MTKEDQYAQQAEAWTERQYADAASYLAHRANLVVALGPGLGPGDEVLDLACGDGGLGELLLARGLRYRGVDSTPEMVAAARERLAGRAEFAVGDLNDYEPPAPVAATTIFRAIYYARDRRELFRRIASYTESKLVFDLNPRQYELDDVLADLRAAGLEQVVLRPFFVPQTVALPRALVATARTLERSGPLARLALRFRFTLSRRGVALDGRASWNPTFVTCAPRLRRSLFVGSTSFGENVGATANSMRHGTSGGASVTVGAVVQSLTTTVFRPVTWPIAGCLSGPTPNRPDPDRDPPDRALPRARAPADPRELQHGEAGPVLRHVVPRVRAARDVRLVRRPGQPAVRRDPRGGRLQAQRAAVDPVQRVGALPARRPARAARRRSGRGRTAFPAPGRASRSPRRGRA